MKFRWLLLLCVLGSCGVQKTQEATRNCAVPPVGFHSVGTPNFTERWPMPIDGYHKNIVKIARSGEITFNGVALSTMDQSAEAILETYLAQVARMTPQPFTVLDFDAGTPCARIQAVRKLMIRHLGCSTGDVCFQGNFK